VITNLFSSSVDSIVPASAPGSCSGCGVATRCRHDAHAAFYSLHYLLPFVIVGAVGLHIWALPSPARTTRRARHQDGVGLGADDALRRQ